MKVKTRLIALLVVGTIQQRLLPGQLRKEPCSNVVTTLGRLLPSDKERRTGNVVEIRVCEAGILQLVAWGTSEKNPLVIETNRTSIVSLVTASDAVFVVETAGASSNVVQVIVFENGVPRLRVNDSIKAYADIQVSWKEVVVRLPSENGESKVFRFPTRIE